MSEVRRAPLTPDEQEALRATRAEWLAHGLSTEPADRAEAEDAVKALYRTMGWKEPMTIWMESPLGGCYASAWFEEVVKAGDKKDQLGDQLWGQLWDQLRGQLWDQLRGQLGGQLWGQLRGQLRGQLGDQLRGQLRDQLRDQLWDQLWGQLGDQLGDQLWDQLRGQLGDQLWGQLWDQLRGQLGDQLRGQLRDQLGDQLRDQLWGQLRGQLGDQLGGQVSRAWWGQHDSPWIAWWRFAREVGATYDKKLNAGLEAWSRIARSSGWWWPREGVVILTERPDRLHRDPAGRLHSEDGPAISYPDGWGVWAWHGVRVGQDVIEDPKALTVERIRKEENAELRRCYMEIYGQGRYMKEAGGELLDEVHEPPFPGLIDAKLWRLPNPEGGEPFTCLECRNSTPEPDGEWKTYHLWVNPELRPLLPENEYGEPQFGEPQELTAHNAVASTFGERGESYLPVAES